MLFVDVILPLPLPQTFTYSVPEGMLLQAGMRVIVPVGARKFYSGIVEKVHRQMPETYAVKEITTALDEHPVVNELQLRLWQWMASYYMCTLGDLMKAAVPAGLKLESETRVYFNPAWVQGDELNTHEEQILNILSEKQQLPVSEIAASYKHKDLMRVVQGLVDKEALWVEEFIAARYKPKYETYIRLHPQITSEAQLKIVFDHLSRAPQQLDALMRLMQLSGAFSKRESKAVSKKELLKGDVSAATVQTLVKKQMMEVYQVEISRLQDASSTAGLPELTAAQQQAFSQIQEHFRHKDVVLLHGVTSSGKTEVYIRLIAEQIRQGKQTLYLLPEIALTAQIINRLKSVFGRRVGIYHSKFSDAERVEVWNHIGKPDGYDVVLGVRSAVFLPFTRLGLVIVDEEHETSYKQNEPAPRYHARDVAIVLASLHGGKTLAGTATPSLESYHNALDGKYGLVELSQRYAGMELPEIVFADTATARKKKTMQSHFHPLMMEAIEQTLKNGKQIILFQNRRGFSPYVQCAVCETVPRCIHCDVSLTYHKFSDRLLCHYCGYSTENIVKCPECGSLEMHTIGFGTEKIEDEIQIIFPEARIARLDLDTSRSRNRYESIIAGFENGKTDILVGTQMISKGLNFEKVYLVGILNADNMLNFPDFRSFERSFQLMTQVSGRAGRFGERGKVIIQSSNPRHQVLQWIAANDFAGMYHAQMAEREQYCYPPFCRLIRLTLKHKSKTIVHQAALETTEYLARIFGKRVLGPYEPVISRVQTLYLENILLKIEKTASIQKAKQLLKEAITHIKMSPDYRSLQITPDVDPA
jgi:primosomal protein N' (replication factor Y)